MWWDRVAPNTGYGESGVLRNIRKGSFHKRGKFNKKNPKNNMKCEDQYEKSFVKVKFL